MSNMFTKWKIFRASFPYICTSCGEFSRSEKDYCEECGEKGSLRMITREDYECHVEKSKSEVPKSKSERTSKRTSIDPARIRRNNTIKMMVIIFNAFIIIDLIGFIILMNILDISLNEIGENLWVFWGLVGFSLVMFIVIVIGVYVAYYKGELYPF